MKFFAFLLEFGDKETIINKLRLRGLLSEHAMCEECGQEMIERPERVKDGFMFFCRKRSCRKSKSIRVNSFFENSRLQLTNIMLFLHLWANEFTEKLIMNQFDFSKKTIVDWTRFCRDLCIFEFEQDESMIGGSGSVVEIDETLLIKRKYNRGRMVSNGWHFGGIERRNDGLFRCFVILVYDRSEAHLTYIIQNRIALGTHIMSNGWAAYRNLSLNGYIHTVVNHSENFINPDDTNTHTQTIESRWSSLK